MDNYQCHKKVNAAQIVKVSQDAPGRFTIYLEGDYGKSHVTVSAGFMQKHSPHEGDYLVEYEDGYQSISPPLPFRAGYSLLKE